MNKHTRETGNRKFGPKSSDHPSIGEPCAICKGLFKEGDYTTLIETEPASEEDIEKKKAGRVYTTQAVEVHYFVCSSGGEHLR